MLVGVRWLVGSGGLTSLFFGVGYCLLAVGCRFVAESPVVIVLPDSEHLEGWQIETAPTQPGVRGSAGADRGRRRPPCLAWPLACRRGARARHH